MAYGTKTEVPIIGKIKVYLRTQVRHKEVATLYVAEDQEEFLLGKEDVKALGILNLNFEGRTQDQEGSSGPDSAPKSWTGFMPAATNNSGHSTAG